MYKIEITASSISELHGRIHALSASLPADTGVRATMPPLTERDSAARPSSNETIEKETARKTAVAEAKAAPKEEKASVDLFKDVAPRVVRLTTEKGRDAVLAVLSKYGAKRAGEVPQDRLADLLADIDAALSA